MPVCRVSPFNYLIMQINRFRVILVAMASMLLASCATYKKINYIQDVEAGKAESIIINEGILIQPKDMISIIVSSKNPELSVNYNLPVVSYQAGAEITSGISARRLAAYVVDNDGNIDFPVLGEIHAAGLTRWELSKEIKSRLIGEGHLKDAVVTVQFMNFKISVLGEVTSPGTYTIDGDKLTILEALSLARDLTIHGCRDRVFVIREKDGERITYQLDLRSVELFNSPAYYLQQNDVIYVEPDKVRAGQSTLNENSVKSASFWISIGSVLTTIATFIVTVLNVTGKIHK